MSLGGLSGKDKEQTLSDCDFLAYFFFKGMIILVS